MSNLTDKLPRDRTMWTAFVAAYGREDARLTIALRKLLVQLPQPRRRRWNGGMPTPGREHE